MIRTALAAGYFGKLPVAADYLSHHAGGVFAEDALLFEGWLQENVTRLRMRYAHAAEKILREAPEVWFLLWGKLPARFLLGVILPGGDSAGRIFPFAVWLQGPSTILYNTFPLIPQTFEGFFGSAAELGKSPIQDVKGLAEMADGLLKVIPDAPSGDAEGILSRLRGTSLERLQGRGDVSSILLCLRALSERANRAAEPPAFGLRFPIPADSDAERTQEGCLFWLEAIRRAFRFTNRLPAFLWRSGGQRLDGILDVYFQNPGGTALSHALDSTLATESLYSLVEGGEDLIPAGSKDADELRARLDDPALSLASALEIAFPATGDSTDLRGGGMA